MGVRGTSLIMQIGLVLLLSLFIVYVGAKDNGKGAELKSLEILGNRVSREANKQKQNKNKIIKQSSKHRKDKIQKKKNNGKINGESKSRKEKKNIKKRQNKSKQASREGNSKGRSNSNRKSEKFKLTERRKKPSRKTPEGSNKARQSCDSGISAACMEAAKTVLVYEGNQVINFIKRYLRYNRQENTTDNKLGKKGLFVTPQKYMEEAMGGNMTTLDGCDSATSKTFFSTNYTFLSNCSALIAEKCTPVTPDEAKVTAMASCYTEMNKIKAETEKCRKLSTDGTAQCACWTTIQSTVNDIKALSPKCVQTMETMAKDMKDAKKTCTKTFSLCKKAEDASVKLINDCMNFDVQALNQSKIADDAGSKLIGF